MKNQKVILIAALVSLAGSFLRCTLPDSIEPVEWNMHVELPVMDRKIPIRDIMALKPRMKLPNDTFSPGDTLAIVNTDKLEYAFEQNLITSDSVVLRKTLGAYTLGEMSPVEISFPVSAGLPHGCSPDQGLPAGTIVSLSRKNIGIEGVSMARFDETSPELNLTVVNGSTSGGMEEIAVALLDSSDAVAVVYVPYLHPGEKRTMKIPVAGKCVRSPVAVAISISLKEGTVIRASDRLDIIFSLTGLVVSEALIEDRLIDYSSTISGELPISDSLQIEKIETEKSILSLHLATPLQCKMKVHCTLKSSGYFDEEMNRAPDPSAAALHDICLFDTLVTFFDSCPRGLHFPLREVALFPEWDHAKAHSTVGCRFGMEIVHDNGLLHYRKNDEVFIKIHPVSLPFKRINGKFMRTIGRKAYTSVNSGLTVTDTNLKRLQKALTFSAAHLTFDLDPGLPQGCSIDSLRVQATMKPSDCTNDSAILVRTLTGLAHGSRHRAAMDFGNLFNRWPDEFTFDLRLMLPAGTGFMVENRIDRLIELGRILKFEPKLSWQSVIPLCWNAREQALLEMEKTVVRFTGDQFDLLGRLRNPEVRIILNVVNNTNVTCRIFGLGSPKRSEGELLRYPDSLIGSDTHLPETLFRVTGSNGVALAPRNNVSLNEVALDSGCIATLLHGEECVIRWFLLVFPGETDALMADDFLQIKSVCIIKGTGTTDMLASPQQDGTGFPG